MPEPPHHLATHSIKFHCHAAFLSKLTASLYSGNPGQKKAMVMFTNDDSGGNKVTGFLKGSLFSRQQNAGEANDQIDTRLELLSESLSARLPQRGYIRH